MRRGQTIVAISAFLSLFAIVGVALYGLPFFYDHMVNEFGWSRKQVTSGNAYSKLLVGPLFGFIAGWVVDRFGAKRLMISGILMAGLALVGLGAISTITLFYVFYLFNALGYVLGGPLPNQVLLSRWFDKGRGRAMGFAYLGIGVGGALVPLVAHALTTRYGWQTALQILGLLIVVVALPCAWLVQERPPEGPGAAAPNASAAAHGVSASAASESAATRVFTHWTFPFLLIGSMCSIGAVGGTMQNLKLLFTIDKGLTQADAASVLSLVLTGSLIGRLLMGWLADRFPKKYVMLLIYALVAATVPLLYLAPTVDSLRVAAVLFGIGLGGDYMIIPLMAAELYGLKILGRVMGVVLTADGVAEALVPMAVASIRDSTQSYGYGFVLLVALATLGAAAVACLPRSSPPRG
jgi:sugar phosphate permease